MAKPGWRAVAASMAAAAIHKRRRAVSAGRSSAITATTMPTLPAIAAGITEANQ